MLLTSQNYQPSPQFTGLSKRLGHHIYIDGKKDICKVLDEKQPENTYVGALPPVIFDALEPENREAAVQNIYKTFDEVSDEIREFRPSITSDSDEYKNRRPKSAVDKLKNLFVKHGVLKEDDPFDIVYLGAGEYKKAFKLEGIKDKKTGEELGLKVFHLVDKSPEWHKYKTHGNYAEINTSIYWKKQHGMDTQRSKFYWGDINHGYFVDKYIDKDVEPPKVTINEYDDGIKLTDEVKDDFGHNKLYGYSIDPGGVRVVNRVKNQSKIAKYVLDKVKSKPYDQRELEWHKIKNIKKGGDEKQWQAGLALCIKHLPKKDEYVEQCLEFHNPFADQGIAYALKYLSQDSAEKYFETLMKRKDVETQVVLMNEIPLLARERLDKLKVDDLDVPKGEIDANRLEKFYNIAEKYALPDSEEHLASYAHLLPNDKMMPAVDRLIAKNSYNINDRLLHKIKFVKDEDYSFGDKITVLNKLEKVEKNEFLKNKLHEVRTRVIRNSLED